jgi:hypothetical protein
VGEIQQGEESRRNCCSRRIHAQGTRSRAIRCRTSGEGLAPGMFTRIAAGARPPESYPEAARLLDKVAQVLQLDRQVNVVDGNVVRDLQDKR